MSVERALAAGRRAAERLMVDTCTIRRRTGEATDPVSGEMTPTYDPVYSGKCRVQQSTGTAQAQAQEAGEANVLLTRFEVQVPMSVTGIQADDEVLVTASVHDPDLPGREFLVRGLAHKTHAVMRRIQCEERTS